jgi:hypothetical protein
VTSLPYQVEVFMKFILWRSKSRFRLVVSFSAPATANRSAQSQSSSCWEKNYIRFRAAKLEANEMRSSENIFRKTASSESSNLQSLATVTNVAWDLLDYYWRRSRTFLWNTCLAKCHKISRRINLPKCPQKPTQWRLATKSFPIQTFPNFRTQATGQSFTARHERAPKITELKNRRTCPFAPAKRPDEKPK